MILKALGSLVLAVAVAMLSLPADAQGPVRIGASLSLTGTYAKLGKNQHEGYQLCIKDLNARGGVRGRKAELVTYDDQSLPATAVRLYFDAYKKEFNHEPSYHSAAGYAGCVIYAEAVKRAGSLDADKVREQLLKLETKTMFGEYKVDADGWRSSSRRGPI